MHRGHQAVLRQARALADAQKLRVVVLTFDPHPALVLRGSGPPVLTTLERRIQLLIRHGADEVVVEPFTQELAALTPEAFAKQLLAERLHARAVVVGANFRFGAHRAGDLATLREHGRALDFDVVAAEIGGDEKGKFSSTRIRHAIAAGDLAAAEAILGRRHSLSGVVEHGDHRGRTIGFPTANVGGVTELLPPYGVYAIFLEHEGASYPGVMNLGVRPTVDGQNLRVEAHLFDFDRDLYGEHVRVHLVAPIRAEMKFAGIDELKAQIATDSEAARALLVGLPPADGG